MYHAEKHIDIAVASAHGFLEAIIIVGNVDQAAAEGRKLFEHRDLHTPRVKDFSVTARIPMPVLLSVTSADRS